MTQSETLETPQVVEELSSPSIRSKMLGVVVAAATLLGLSEQRASATYAWLCCDLAHNNDGPCGCSGNYSIHAWYCYYGSTLIGCYECNTGTTCHNGSFQCSWWAYA